VRKKTTDKADKGLDNVSFSIHAIIKFYGLQIRVCDMLMNRRYW